MKKTFGIRPTGDGENRSPEAAVIHRIYNQWRPGRPHDVMAFEELFYSLRAEYRHLTSEQRIEKIPALLLAALNDPDGGFEIDRRRRFWERVA